MIGLQTIIQDLTYLTSSNYLLEENGTLVPKPVESWSLKGLICKRAQATPLDLDPTYQARQANFITKRVRWINSVNFEILFPERKRIKTLFFNRLVRWQYDRREITFGSSLERILIGEKPIGEDRIDSVTEKPIRTTLREAEFSVRLGIAPEKAKSKSTDTYYIFSRNGERLGIFKPAMKKWFFNDNYGAAEARHHYLSETTTSAFSDFLKLNVVPFTTQVRWTISLSTLKNCVGSFQLYAAETTDLFSRLEGDNLWDPDHKALADRLDNPHNRSLAFSNFEEYSLLELLTGNNDGHFRNILTKDGPNGTRFIGIDNGNSFPWRNKYELPFYKMVPNHDFKWSTLPHALKPYSSAMIEKIKQLNVLMLTNIMMDRLNDKHSLSSFVYFDGKLHTFYRRVSIIQSMAREGRTIREIAESLLSKTVVVSSLSSSSSTLSHWIH